MLSVNFSHLQWRADEAAEIQAKRYRDPKNHVNNVYSTGWLIKIGDGISGHSYTQHSFIKQIYFTDCAWVFFPYPYPLENFQKGENMTLGKLKKETKNKMKWWEICVLQFSNLHALAIRFQAVHPKNVIGSWDVGCMVMTRETEWMKRTTRHPLRCLGCQENDRLGARRNWQGRSELLA